MAFVNYRLSKECRNESDRASMLRKALSTAVSDKAVLKLRWALGLDDTEEGKEAAPQINARIPLGRLMADDTVARPVPVLGRMDNLSAASIANAPQADILPDKFGIFKPSADSSWVALPAWPRLADAVQPIGMLLSDATMLPDRQATKGGEEVLLVVDAGDVAQSLQSDQFFYLVASSSGEAVALASGHAVRAGGLQVLGKAIMALLPPSPEEAEEVWE